MLGYGKYMDQTLILSHKPTKCVNLLLPHWWREVVIKQLWQFVFAWLSKDLKSDAGILRILPISRSVLVPAAQWPLLEEKFASIHCVQRLESSGCRSFVVLSPDLMLHWAPFHLSVVILSYNWVDYMLIITNGESVYIHIFMRWVNRLTYGNLTSTTPPHFLADHVNFKLIVYKIELPFCTRNGWNFFHLIRVVVNYLTTPCHDPSDQSLVLPKMTAFYN